MTKNNLFEDWTEIYAWFIGIGFVLWGLFTYFALPRIIDLPCNYTCKQQLLQDKADEYIKSRGL